MARLLYNNQGGLLGANPGSGGTTITFAVAPNFATISGGDYIPIILDSGTVNAEIVYLTAYTAAATTGTIARAAEDSSHWPAVAHPSGTWTCAPTVYDFKDVPGTILASKVYAPASRALVTVGTSLAALDTTNMTLAFTVPYSGNVDVTIEGCLYTAMSGSASATSVPSLALLNHSGGAQLGNTHSVYNVSASSGSGGGEVANIVTTTFKLTGLTPGALQVDFAAGKSVSVGNTIYFLVIGAQSLFTSSNIGSEFIMIARAA